MLDRRVSDWDVATDARPAEVTRLYPRTAPTGAAHGTITVLTDGGAVEVTTFRQEGPYSDRRHPDNVQFVDDVEGDLARRDFTINAIAYDPSTKEVVDPFGGRADLGRRTVRAVGDPLDRFSEDALRLLRAIRLAAALGFEIEDGTFQAISKLSDKISHVAPERIREELMKIMVAGRPSVAFEMMRGTSLLTFVLPELEESVGVPQNKYHAYDVYFHSLMTCDAVSAEKPLVRLAGLLHDVGKPMTRKEIRGDATFYNHQSVGADMADVALRRLRFSRAEREHVLNLIRNHMFNYTQEWSDGALRRFVKRVGEESIADLFDLRIADRLGNGLKEGFPVYLEEMRDRIDSILREAHALRVSDLQVSGEDVMRELGLGPGPKVGAVLEQLLDAVLEDPSLNTRDRLLGMIKEAKCEE